MMVNSKSLAHIAKQRTAQTPEWSAQTRELSDLLDERGFALFSVETLLMLVTAANNGVAKGKYAHGDVFPVVCELIMDVNLLRTQNAERALKEACSSPTNDDEALERHLERAHANAYGSPRRPVY
jgi:hypothetical protein